MSTFVNILRTLSEYHSNTHIFLRAIQNYITFYNTYKEILYTILYVT